MSQLSSEVAIDARKVGSDGVVNRGDGASGGNRRDVWCGRRRKKE